MYAKTPLQQARGRSNDTQQNNMIASHRVVADHKNYNNQKKANKSFTRPTQPEQLLERIRIYNKVRPYEIKKPT